MIWPTGDSGKLRAAAAGWSTAATQFGVAEIVGTGGPMGAVRAQQIPEGPAIDQAFTAAYTSTTGIVQQSQKIAAQLNSYAAKIDRVHAAILDLLSRICDPMTGFKEVWDILTDEDEDEIKRIADDIRTVANNFASEVSALEAEIAATLSEAATIATTMGDYATKQWDQFLHGTDVGRAIDQVGQYAKGMWGEAFGFVKGIWGLSSTRAMLDPVGFYHDTRDEVEGALPLVGLGPDGGPGVGESWKTLGKGIVHWDEWEKNPAEALGRSVFDVGTLVLPGGPLTKLGKWSRDAADALKGLKPPRLKPPELPPLKPPTAQPPPAVPKPTEPAPKPPEPGRPAPAPSGKPGPGPGEGPLPHGPTETRPPVDGPPKPTAVPPESAKPPVSVPAEPAPAPHPHEPVPVAAAPHGTPAEPHPGAALPAPAASAPSLPSMPSIPSIPELPSIPEVPTSPAGGLPGEATPAGGGLPHGGDPGGGAPHGLGDGPPHGPGDGGGPHGPGDGGGPHGLGDGPPHGPGDGPHDPHSAHDGPPPDDPADGHPPEIPTPSDLKPWHQAQLTLAEAPQRLMDDLLKHGCPRDIAESALHSPYEGMSAQDILNRFWDPVKGTWDWPESKGFLNGKWETARSIPETLHLDRIGEVSDTRGDFMGAAGDSYPGRGLAPGSSGDYHRFHGTGKELPEGWEVRYGAVADAFGQPGGGTQWVVVDNNGEIVLIHDLIEDGYLARG